MKKTYLIIIGISAIVILFSIWVYLLINGTPTKVTDIFANFGMYTSTSSVPVEVIPQEPTPTTSTVDVSPAKLRQLTTKPVIGFREFQASSTEPKFIRYAEAGTGHIYSINLTTGEETRLSNTTIPNAQKAVFSSDGKYAAVRSGYTNNSPIILLTLNDTGSGLAEKLTPPMTDFIFVGNDLLYSEITNYGMSGYKFNLITKGSQVIFNVPFQSATIVWATDPNGITYVYPKANSKLNGYLYQIKNGTLARLPLEGKGLTAKGDGSNVFFTLLTGSENISQIYNQITSKFGNSPIIMEPNKCAFSNRNSQIVYCGYQLTSYPSTFPDEWYKGQRAFNDDIWSVNLSTQSGSHLVIPEKDTGRSVDITDMMNSPDGKVLYFKNKNDNTLWMYEI